MAESQTAPGDHLIREALLYAAGELEGPALDDFEGRLGAHPETQQALAQAVQLSLVLEGRPLHPDPAYRSAVRDRCVPPARREHYFWRRAGFGLVAALLLALAPAGSMSESLEDSLFDDEAAAAPGEFQTVSTVSAVDDDRRGDESVNENDMLEMALDWAEMSGVDGHLQRTWDEESRRRARQRERVRAEVEPSWEGAVSPATDPD